MRIRVDLYLFAKKEGGRASGIDRHYRPDFNWGAEHHGVFSASIEFLAREVLPPGESSRAVIVPRHPEYWGELRIGNILAMREGGRQVGSARILAIEP